MRMQRIQFLLELGCNVHPLIQDSYNLYVTVFNQPIEQQVLMASSASPVAVIHRVRSYSSQ